jgi:hypothetical protein
MIAETTITDDTWAEAPEDSEAAFLFITQRARARYQEMAASAGSDENVFSSAAWRQQYVHEVCAVAEQLGIDGLGDPDRAAATTDNMNEFDRRLARVLTLLKAKGRLDLREHTAKLTYSTKAAIRDDLEKLRMKVNASNLSDKEKAALHKRIAAVERELEATRFSMPSVWLLAGAIALHSPDLVGAASDLPGAIKTVESIVNAVHQDNRVEHRSNRSFDQPLLERASPKAITDQSIDTKLT